MQNSFILVDIIKQVLIPKFDWCQIQIFCRKIVLSFWLMSHPQKCFQMELVRTAFSSYCPERNTTEKAISWKSKIIQEQLSCWLEKEYSAAENQFTLGRTSNTSLWRYPPNLQHIFLDQNQVFFWAKNTIFSPFWRKIFGEKSLKGGHFLVKIFSGNN